MTANSRVALGVAIRAAPGKRPELFDAQSPAPCPPICSSSRAPVKQAVIKRRVTTVLVYVLLGAALTVATAWGSIIACPVSQDEDRGFSRRPTAEENRWWSESPQGL